MAVDYRDNYWAGKLDDVLIEFERELTLFRITGKMIAVDGTIQTIKKKYKIYGSLQAWRRTRNYKEDGPDTTSRKGKLLVRYQYKLREGDIVQKGKELYRVMDINDYDYAEVHDYVVERVGLDEDDYISNFDEYLEEEFPSSE